MSDQENAIFVSRSGDVATILLNRPAARNAVNFTMLLRLADEIDALRHTPPRVILLRAATPGFCAGLDLKDPREAEGRTSRCGYA